MSRFLLGAITWYQKHGAKYLGNRCIYSPSCSHYAREAISRYGAFKGLKLALNRLSRCRYFYPGGRDPVP